MSENTTLENKVTADREPSALHENFRDWIEETTGYDADLKTVQLAASLRIKFQKSEVNQEDLKARKAAAEAKIGSRAEAAEARAIAAAERAEAKKKADAEKLAKKEAAALAKAKEAATKTPEQVEDGADVDPMDPEAPMLPLPAAKPARRRTAATKTATPAKKAAPTKKAATAKSTAAPAEA